MMPTWREFCTDICRPVRPARRRRRVSRRPPYRGGHGVAVAPPPGRDSSTTSVVRQPADRRADLPGALAGLDQVVWRRQIVGQEVAQADPVVRSDQLVQAPRLPCHGTQPSDPGGSDPGCGRHLGNGRFAVQMSAQRLRCVWLVPPRRRHPAAGWQGRKALPTLPSGP